VLSQIRILCGLLVAITAIVVQTGWLIHSVALVQINRDFSPMQFNTALCFLFCGINLIFLNASSRFLKSTGLLATALAGITLSQYLFHTNYGIDTLFISPFTQANSPAIGRMSITSGVNFILMGTVIFFAANFCRNKIINSLVMLISSSIIALAIVPLLAYLSGIQTAYPWNNLTGMAVHTSFSFIFLGIGVICQLWFYSKKQAPYFLLVPVVLCLMTASFSISGAISTYENVKYKELLQVENYYAKHPASVTPVFKANILTSESSYIAYFVLIFGLLTTALLTLTIYFHIKWRQNAKALESNQERLQLAITGTTDGLFDWNVSTGEFYYSPRFEQVLGYTTNSLDPHFANFIELIHPKDKSKFQQSLIEHFKNHTTINMELRLQTKNHDYIWFNFRGTPTSDSTGLSKRMTGFIADISTRNEIDQLKNDFISTVSHELRTPMTSINGSLVLAISGKAGPCEGKIKDLLLIAERNCERLLRLINDILDVEKIETGRMDFNYSVCDLAKIISETITNNQMYADSFNIKLVFQPIADINVKVAVDRLIQVLTNLISNAVKFARTGTVVNIVMVRLNNKVRVDVSNEGAGIPDNFRSSIFHKFSQADCANVSKTKGTGLGLCISKAIMETLGGNLDFTSVVNGVTTFYLELPIVNT
jgi:PAS domain S-box-containing protein